MHIGGDEVQLKCWEEDPALVVWVSQHNTTMRDLFRDFEYQIFEIVRQLGEYMYAEIHMMMYVSSTGCLRRTMQIIHLVYNSDSCLVCCIMLCSDR